MPDAILAPEVGSPQWWLLRLLRKLHGRVADLNRWDAYYRGDQPLAFASSKFRESFGERFPAFSSNFCELVVNGTAERLEVAGFRFGSEAANRAAWDIWQQNDMDANSQLAHQEALIKGMAYALVEPDEGGPIITIEDGCDAIVATDPKSRKRRLAGLKRWIDDKGQLVVYLYLPDALYKYTTKAKWTDEFSRWYFAPIPWEDGYEFRLWGAAEFVPLEVPGEEWPVPNPLKVVPLIELPNRPRLKLGGQSEIAAIRSNQDAVNKYRTDALIASEFAAFPQRYLLNFEPETDAETGRAKEPFKAAIDRLWTVPPPDPDNPDAPEAKFGQFEAASLEPYVRMIELEVGHIGSISRMPYHELLASPTSVPPSAESIKSSEAGLVRKVGRIETFLGEGWEEVLRTSFLATESPAAKVQGAETVWLDSETRNEAVRTDAVVKLHGAGIIDDELAWEMAGLTRAQIEALRDRLERAAKAAAAEPPPPPPTPGEVVPAPTGPQMGPYASPGTPGGNGIG